MRSWKIAATACAVALGGASAATAAPALPSNATAEEKQAWVDEHIVAGAEILANVGELQADLFDPARFEKGADGHLKAWVRGEYYRPVRIGSGSYRSLRQLFEMDCQSFRVKVLAREGFRDNNLGGPSAQLGGFDEWTQPLPADSVGGRELRQACSYASLVGSPDWVKATPPPPPVDADDEAVRSWRARHLTSGDHVFLTTDGGTFYFYSPADLERTKEGRVKVRLREEFAFPSVIETTGLRSMLTTYEFDCEKRRYRTSDHVVFPGANLLGTPYADLPESELWSLATAGDVDSRLGGALCRLATDAKLSAEDAVRPEAVPPPAAMDIAGVRAWAHRYVNLNDYALIRPNTTGLQLYWPRGLTLLPNGNVTVFTRMEAYEPQTFGSLSVRSGLFETEFDCRTPRNRVVRMELHEQLNLEGPVHAADGTPWKSFDGNPDGAKLREQLCSQRELLGPDVDVDLELALIPNPRSSEDEDVADWVEQYIVGDDVYVGHNQSLAGFFSVAEGERTRQDQIRIWTRMEYFDPEVEKGGVIRSARTLQEFDCAEGRTRILATEAYPGANLTGRKREDKLSESAWTYVRPQTLESLFADAVCELKDQADAEAVERMSEPQLPDRGGKTPL